jgi:hypothetical protein
MLCNLRSGNACLYPNACSNTGNSPCPSPKRRNAQSQTTHSSSRKWDSICSTTKCRTACLDSFVRSLCVPLQGRSRRSLRRIRSRSSIGTAPDNAINYLLFPNRSIEDRASQRLPKFFRRMEETIKASDDLLKELSGSRWRSIWEVMKDTIMLEPNFSGVGVDLKAARSRFLVTANIS